MIFTFQTATQVVWKYWPAMATLTVTDTNGYSTLYAYTPLPDGTAILNGAILLGNESPERRQAAACFINYQLNPSSSIQVQRLSNGIIEVFDPGAPIHLGGNPTRYSVINGQVSTTTYIVGSGPNSYVSQANAFLSAHNFS
jgi:hypothetical protein